MCNLELRDIPGILRSLVDCGEEPEAAGPGLVFCPESSPVSSPPPAGHQTPQLGSVYRVVRVGAASQTTYRGMLPFCLSSAVCSLEQMMDRTVKLKTQPRSSLSKHHTTSFRNKLNIWTICLVRLFRRSEPALYHLSAINKPFSYSTLGYTSQRGKSL